MKINFKNNIPCQVPGISIPGSPYKEFIHPAEDLLNKNWITSSVSTYPCPVVKKKNDILRLCWDKWKLKVKIIPDCHPLPQIKNQKQSSRGVIRKNLSIAFSRSRTPFFKKHVWTVVSGKCYLLLINLEAINVSPEQSIPTIAYERWKLRHSSSRAQECTS